MGAPAGGTVDQARNVASGPIAAVGAGSSTFIPEARKPFNFHVTGTFTATFRLERSLDGGATFAPISMDTAGTPSSYSAPLSMVCMEPEPDAVYRVYCNAFTSGTINWRLSQ